MKAPFELPIEANEELLMLHIQGKLRASLIIGDVDNWNDEARLAYLRYIVQCVNSHEALLDTCKELLGDWWCARSSCQDPECRACQNAKADKLRYETIIAQAEKEGLK